MRIFSIPFLSSSYIVITIQYLKALWGRPHRNTIDRRPKIKKTSGKQKKTTKKTKKTIFSDSSGVTPWKKQKNLEKTKKTKKNKKKTIFSDSSGVTPWKNQKNLEKTKKNKKTKKTNIFRLFWGHSMKTPKKPWENQKNKKNKKNQYFQTLLGSLHEKTKKTLRKPKKTKKPKKTIFRNYLEGPPPQRIAKYCFFFLFFLVFSRFFWFFHGVTPEESEHIVFFFFGFLKVFLVFSWSDPRRVWKYCFFLNCFMEWPQKIIRIWKLIISPIFLKCKHCLSLMHLPIRNWTVSNPNYCLDLSVIHASVQLQLSHFNSKLLPGSSHLLLRFF